MESRELISPEGWKDVRGALPTLVATESRRPWHGSYFSEDPLGNKGFIPLPTASNLFQQVKKVIFSGEDGSCIYVRSTSVRDVARLSDNRHAELTHIFDPIATLRSRNGGTIQL